MGREVFNLLVPSNVGFVDINLSSSPLTKGDLYELVINSVANNTFLISVNTDHTTSNYTTQKFESGAAISASRNTNSNTLTETSPNATTNAYLRLHNIGNFVWNSEVLKDYSSATPTTQMFYGKSKNLFSNITNIRISATTIPANTRIQLRKIAVVVNDVNVTTDTTTVEFTNLNITQGQPHIIALDLVFRATASQFRFFVNNSDQFNHQGFFGNNTTTGANRGTGTDTGGTGGPGFFYSLRFFKFGLTNNNYIYNFFQTSGGLQSNDVIVAKRNYFSNFTATTINSFRLSTNFSNGIASDSRVTLYKLI